MSLKAARRAAVARVKLDDAILDHAQVCLVGERDRGRDETEVDKAMGVLLALGSQRLAE